MALTLPAKLVQEIKAKLFEIRGIVYMCVGENIRVACICIYVCVYMLVY